MISSAPCENVHICKDVSDAQELYKVAGLFLKPISKVDVSVALPELANQQSVSTDQVLKKLSLAVKPVVCSSIRVVSRSESCITFQAEVLTKLAVEDVVKKINMKGLKLDGSSDPMRIHAGESKVDGPSADDWNRFFYNNAKMNCNKPGKRPDTITLEGLPIKWFAYPSTPDTPSELILQEIMSQFGKIRCIDIPINDSMRPKMAEAISGLTPDQLHSMELFNLFVQFEEADGFEKCMAAFRGHRLCLVDQGEAWTCSVKVACDCTQHLSAEKINLRKEEHDRLLAVEVLEVAKRNKDQELQNALNEANRVHKADIQEAYEQKKAVTRREKEERRMKREQARRAKKEAKMLAEGRDLEVAIEQQKLLKARLRLLPEDSCHETAATSSEDGYQSGTVSPVMQNSAVAPVASTSAAEPHLCPSAPIAVDSLPMNGSSSTSVSASQHYPYPSHHWGPNSHVFPQQIPVYNHFNGTSVTPIYHEDAFRPLPSFNIMGLGQWKNSGSNEEGDPMDGFLDYAPERGFSTRKARFSDYSSSGSNSHESRTFTERGYKNRSRAPAYQASHRKRPRSPAYKKSYSKLSRSPAYDENYRNRSISRVNERRGRKVGRSSERNNGRNEGFCDDHTASFYRAEYVADLSSDCKDVEPSEQQHSAKRKERYSDDSPSESHRRRKRSASRSDNVARTAQTKLLNEKFTEHKFRQATKFLDDLDSVHDRLSCLAADKPASYHRTSAKSRLGCRKRSQSPTLDSKLNKKGRLAPELSIKRL